MTENAPCLNENEEFTILFHQEDFEKEALFHDLLFSTPGLRSGGLKRIIAAVNPDFMAGLFEMRPCVRQLKYVGYINCGGVEFDSEEDELVIGEIYESVAFNGGMYELATGRQCGCYYFERLT